ncbi:MAG: amidase [Geminicoccaceae bacterium]|nr:amidase [Geminicoccaceae bacterium]
MDLLERTACELAAAVRAREVSPVELVEAALARIEAVQPALNCFAFVYPEQARLAAVAAERKLKTGEPVGPLHGVPVALKDFTPVAGLTTTLGSHAYAGWIPDRDPVIWLRLRAAGAILIGKTTTPEFAHSSFTWSPLWGITCNPWNLERTPGGSSGGAGAAVASGCVPLAEGTDMGGSVRIPASFSGLVGLKPSLGRIPMDILPTTFDSISHFGPLARSVEDAALFLKVTQGPDDADIQSLPAGPDPTARLGESVRGKRFAYSPDLGFMAVQPEVRREVEASLRLLQQAGAEVEEVRVPWDRSVMDDWVTNWGVMLAACFGQHLEAFKDRMTPAVVELIEAGLKVDAVTLRRLEFARTRRWHDLAHVLEDHDALICPTMTRTAPAADGRDDDYGAEDEQGRLLGLDMTGPFNFTAACPALSVPSGFDDAGLPVGLQIVGRRHDDAGVLAIGAAIERLRPWRQHWPPMAPELGS